MNMKKMIFFALAGVMSLGLAACSAVGGVRPVSHRAWGGQMAVFSGYVECKGHSVLQ